MIRVLAALLLGLTLGTGWCSAFAQAPDSEETLYMDACFVRASGATKGQALQVTNSQGAYKFILQDFRGYPQPPVPAVGQIAGDRITFDATIVGLPVHFEGTITPQEIKGHFSNADSDSRYIMDVRWPKWPADKRMPDCP